jgi:hypothetical protein
MSGLASGEGFVCNFTGPGTVFIQTRNPVSCPRNYSFACTDLQSLCSRPHLHLESKKKRFVFLCHNFFGI